MSYYYIATRFKKDRNTVFDKWQKKGEVNGKINCNRNVDRWGNHGCNNAKSSTGKQ